jgi:hypothetical protein
MNMPLLSHQQTGLFFRCVNDPLLCDVLFLCLLCIEVALNSEHEHSIPFRAAAEPACPT